jgi:hypothetical protein
MHFCNKYNNKNSKICNKQLINHKRNNNFLDNNKKYKITIRIRNNKLNKKCSPTILNSKTFNKFKLNFIIKMNNTESFGIMNPAYRVS